MYKKLNPENAFIWRITHRDNLAWYLEHGLHCPNSTIQDPNYVTIGNEKRSVPGLALRSVPGLALRMISRCLN